MSYTDRVDCLSTPCGDIVITDKQGNRLTFSVSKNPFDCDYDIYPCGIAIYVRTEYNYILTIDAAQLKKGELYRIFLIGTALGFGGSDEHTECLSGYSNGYSIAIGSYDPNDYEKLDQAYEYSNEKGIALTDPPSFDRSRFRLYDVEMSDDFSGFSFELIDDECTEIRFSVAWIENQPGLEDYYEGAVSFWTT